MGMGRRFACWEWYDTQAIRGGMYSQCAWIGLSADFVIYSYDGVTYGRESCHMIRRSID